MRQKGDPVRVKGMGRTEKVSAVNGEYIGITRTLQKLQNAGTFEFTTWYAPDELEDRK